MQCDLCGREPASVVADIEGSQLNVCSNCSSFGKVIKAVAQPRKEEQKRREIILVPKKEILQVIVSDYGQRIRQARESLNLTQEDFAKRINEKESLVHNMESGKFEPSMDLARKLEKFLKIPLVEAHEEQHEKISASGGEALTIGDLLRIKTK